MRLAILILYINALTCGLIAIFLSCYLYIKHKKKVILSFIILLSSIFLIILRLTISSEAFGNWAVENTWLENVYAGLNAVAYFFIVVNALYFYHLLTGISISRKKNAFFVLIVFLMLLNVLHYLVIRSEISFIILKAPLYFVIVYGGVFVFRNLKKIGHKQIKKFLTIFTVISLLFTPYFFVDGILTKTITGSPIYYIIVIILCLYFAFSYFNKPNYLQGNTLTAYFKTTFNLTFREVEIIEQAIKGLSNSQIGESLFISPKTVENHMKNIYSKLGINNRFQLFSLLISNSDTKILTD